MGNRSWS